MHTITAVRHDFRNRVAFAGHELTRLVQMLVAHIERTIRIDLGQQVPQQDFASAVGGPYYILLLMIVKVGFSACLAVS